MDEPIADISFVIFDADTDNQRPDRNRMVRHYILPRIITIALFYQQADDNQ